MRLRILPLLLLCAAPFSLFAADPSLLPLIPAPVSWVRQAQGTFLYSSATRVEARGGAAASRVAAGWPKSELKGAKNVVLVELDPASGLGAEGYRMVTTPDTLRLVAANEAGLFYGAASARQLIVAQQNKLLCGAISDQPRYTWRGFMLDESRHFFGKEKVKQYLDLMAGLKLNVFHWHLTDEPGWRIEIKKYPKLTQIGATGNWHNPTAPPQFYTQDDIREIVAYAAARHIMVVPEIDVPGHASAAGRAYPEVSGGGEGRWKDFTFNPAKEVTFEFLGNVLDEICALFPAPYIHIGGDEVHYGNQSWFTDPEIQQFIQTKGLGDEKGLEHYFVRRVAKMITDRNRTLVGWDEIVDAGVSPSQAVVMWWRHDRQDQLLKALANGYQVVMTPRRPLYGDFIQDGSHQVGRTWQGYNPITDVVVFPEPIAHLFQGRESQVLGLQLTMWTERVSTAQRLDYMTFPRLAAVAETAWTPAIKKDASLFMQRLPLFLQELDRLNIYYYDPFNPARRTEPSSPEMEDVLQNG